MVVLPGSEHALKQSVIAALAQLVLGDGEDQETSLTRFSGKDVDLKAVRDELLTVSMWSDRRLVVVDGAADFVSKNRAGLEEYLEKPAKKSVLVLEVKSWPKNTRIAKSLAKCGLVIECSELKGQALTRWIQETARTQHGKQLDGATAQLLAELAGSNLGLLEQEVTKLAAYVGENSRIGAEDVRKLVGGWKAETTWAMLDALRDGDISHALVCLEKLLVAGEAPQRILGGITFVFRKLAIATELARQGTSLSAALKQAGVFPRDVSPATRYLRRIGRPRAEKIYSWLLEADTAMKGGSRLPERIQLETLLVRLGGAI